MKRFVAVLAGTLVVTLVSGSGTIAQEAQGNYVTQAANRLASLISKANATGYVLENNTFSIGGGWLKQGTNNWVALFTLELKEGKEYRILAAGDDDAKDVDVQVLDPARKVVAEDTDTAAVAAVNFRPGTTQKYLIRVRVFASRENLPCACLAIVLDKR